jgi:hypothetical protein
LQVLASGLDEAARRALEAIVNLEQFKKQTLFYIEGRDDGRAEALEALREAIADLCEAYGVELSEAQRTDLASRDLAALEALRLAIKQRRAWPASPPSSAWPASPPSSALPG